MVIRDFKIGDRVYYHGNLNSKFGGFAQFALAEAISVTRIPAEISCVDGNDFLHHCPFTDHYKAAAVPCAGWTAYKAVVDKARIRAGETILITAGAGGKLLQSLNPSRCWWICHSTCQTCWS